jgi:hypothetical protein
MLTGSKFYQAPPFCGAMLVPQSIYQKMLLGSDKLKHLQWGDLFSNYDLPLALRSKIDLPNLLNHASIARWKIALRNLSLYDQLSTERTKIKIEAWHNSITKYLANNQHFELMPFQEKSNQTIISFRVCIGNIFLDYDELKILHSSIVLDDYEATHSFQRIFIGQPVRYGKKSFLRLAIGANNIRKFILEQEEDFEIDYQIIQIIESKLVSLYGHYSTES